MHYKKLNPSFDPYKKELPPYLGYGQLDDESVHYGDGEINGSYYLHGHKVYDVKWNDHCELMSLFDDEFISITSESSLSKAFQHDWLGSCFSDKGDYIDPRMLCLAQSISKLSMYFKYPKPVINEDVFCYYPAGKLFQIMIPIPEVRMYESSVDTLKGLMHENGEIISLLEENEIKLFSLNNVGETCIEDIQVINITATLSRLYEAAVLIRTSNIASYKKKYAPFFCDVEEAIDWSFHVNLGNPKDDYLTYGFLSSELYQDNQIDVDASFLINSQKLVNDALNINKEFNNE